MKKAICLVALVACMGSFGLEIGHASDVSGEPIPTLSSESLMTPIEDGLRRVYAATHIVGRYDIGIKGRALLLVCSGAKKSGALGKLQMIVVDEAGEKSKVLQRIKLGDGEMPDVTIVGEDHAKMLMVRIIRAGNNTEAYVCSLSESGGIKELMRITRALVERYKISIRGVMQSGGMMQIRARRPEFEADIDMSGALDALIEDGLYQENGRPIPAIVNLRCVRIGWEGEELYMSGDGPTVAVGVSIMADNKKNVLTAKIEFRRDETGRMAPVSMTCEPFLPYLSD